MAESSGLSFAQTLELLSFSDGEDISLCWQAPAGFYCWEVCRSAAQAVEVFDYQSNLNPARDFWFTPNPLTAWRGEYTGPGRCQDVIRLGCLEADLDVKDSGAGDYTRIDAIISTLSEKVGTRPMMLLYSGHGTRPVWPVVPSSQEHLFTCGQAAYTVVNRDARRLVKRWGRVVESVARQHDCSVDPTWDLIRKLRVPGSVNIKDPEQPVPVLCVGDDGWPVTVEQITAALDAFGVSEPRTQRRSAVRTGTRRMLPSMRRRFMRTLTRRVRDSHERNRELFAAGCQAVREGLMSDEDDGGWEELAQAAADAGLADHEIISTLRSALRTVQED